MKQKLAVATGAIIDDEAGDVEDMDDQPDNDSEGEQAGTQQTQQ